MLTVIVFSHLLHEIRLTAFMSKYIRDLAVVCKIKGKRRVLFPVLYLKALFNKSMAATFASGITLA